MIYRYIWDSVFGGYLTRLNKKIQLLIMRRYVNDSVWSIQRKQEYGYHILVIKWNRKGDLIEYFMGL